MIGCLVKSHLNRNPKGGVACHVMSGLGNSHFKDPKARACSTYSGNIPEANVAREGSEMAIWGDEVQNGTTHCPNSLSWTCPIYTCGPSIVINRCHPHSLRCLGLNDRVFGHLFREAKRSGASRKGLLDLVGGSHGRMWSRGGGDLTWVSTD